MLGIYIAAIATTVLSLAVIGGLLLYNTPKQDWPFLATVMALHLPMCALSFYCFRLPLDDFVRTTVGQSSQWYGFLTTLYAPLLEEPSKLWLLLVPSFAARLVRKNALRLAMAIGLGFGIGEMWLVAHWISLNPKLAVLPWYMFNGYANERFMVCVMHGAFTATALRTIHEVPVRSILSAMALHFLVNFPIFLAAKDIGGLGKTAWQIILSVWVPLYFIAMLVLMAYLYELKLSDIRLKLCGRAKCPECGQIYVRPLLLAVNVFELRYEFCPNCRHFHWTRPWKEELSDP